MLNTFKRSLRWRVAIAKCSLLTIINAGTLLIATMQNWDDSYVSSLRWWSWLVVFTGLLVNICTTVYTFLDKTFHTESEKIKSEDTQEFKKGEIVKV